MLIGIRITCKLSSSAIMLANLHFLDIVQCLNKPFIICYNYQCVVSAQSTMQVHLQKAHGLPPLLVVLLLATCLDLTKIASKTVGQLLASWPNGVMLVQGLLVFLGYQCPHCSLCIVSREVVQRHQHKEHQDYSKASYDTVQLQTQFSTNHGGPGIQWQQVDALGPAPLVQLGLLANQCNLGVHKRVEQFMQALGQVHQSKLATQVLLDLDPNLDLVYKEQLVVSQLGGLQCTSNIALYVHRTNQLATFTKLQHQCAMYTLTYLPKAVAREPSLLLLQLGNIVLKLAMYKYTTKTKDILDYILQYILLVQNQCQTTFCTTSIAFYTCLAFYTKGIVYQCTFAQMQNKNTFWCYTSIQNQLLYFLFQACQTNMDAKVELVDIWLQLFVGIQN